MTPQVSVLRLFQSCNTSKLDHTKRLKAVEQENAKQPSNDGSLNSGVGFRLGEVLTSSH